MGKQFQGREDFLIQETHRELQLSDCLRQRPKHALSDPSWKATHGNLERVRDLRLTNAEKWVSVRRSISSKLSDEYVGASLREVTWEESRDEA